MRYGDYVYGAIFDASTSPQLGRWDGGATAIVTQTNAPHQFKDLQVHAKRLFVLGGTVPGTSTPVVNGGRTLFYSDANPAANLALTASWQDDVSGLTNRIDYVDSARTSTRSCGRTTSSTSRRTSHSLFRREAGNRNEEAGTTVAARIETEWRSRIITLGSPTNLAMIRRILLDYKYRLRNEPSDVATDNAFTITAYDTLGNELVTATTEGSQDDRRRRFQVDCYAEADAVANSS